MNKHAKRKVYSFSNTKCIKCLSLCASQCSINGVGVGVYWKMSMTSRIKNCGANGRSGNGWKLKNMHNVRVDSERLMADLCADSIISFRVEIIAKKSRLSQKNTDYFVRARRKFRSGETKEITLFSEISSFIEWMCQIILSELKLSSRMVSIDIECWDWWNHDHSPNGQCDAFSIKMNYQ